MQMCMLFCIRNQQTAVFRSNFLNVVRLSMSNRIEYLVKYSVAPPPSRDYYGLKVFQDEVILYLWKISHGPHKAPIVYHAKLIEFDQEKSLQDEIRRGFGKYLLQYVNNIAEGHRNTLLTLPKSIIGKISRYLKFTDIIKLSSLSHIAYEIFNTDLVWQILYTRDKKANISLEEKDGIIVYGWKQLYKAKQMQTIIKEQKKFQAPNLSVTNNAKTNKLLIKPINDPPKSVSNKTSTINTTKKNFESSMTTIPLSKTISDTRFRTYTKNVKPLLQKEDTKNTSSSFNVNETNVRKDTIKSKMKTGKQEIGSVSKCNKIFGKQINQTTKSEKFSNKINISNTNLNKIDNINTKLTSTQESKLKSKTQTASKTSNFKNTLKNIKASSVLTQNLHSKTQLRDKSKKKEIATKSQILNTDKVLSEDPFIVGDDRIDLADLIEASLTNIRSPRSIFDYDFSCVQKSNKPKDIMDIRNEIQNKLKELKSTESNAITNNFSNKIIQNERTLEKVSKEFEPFSEASNEYLVNDKSVLSKGNNKSFSLSEKYMKAREELLKCLDLKQNDPEFSQWDPDISF
ncbi:uncharacterized protein LOC118644333 [Monomorium pharaonis]|uniref:uncharacterized protein LOC118644333 n=1 Tax=Monomorium pharaonis TaxID=307658 RepID=UPI001746AF46|nr:uncharacterized protein LOC118644333 [Monomorium pharaonis]